MPSAASTSMWYLESITINVVVWNWRSTKIEVSNSPLHAKSEGNKLLLGFYVTDTHDSNMTDKVTFQHSYIKTFISLLQFSTPPHGFLSCTVEQQINMPRGNLDRFMLIMKPQPKEKLSVNTYMCVSTHAWKGFSACRSSS